jgi:group I intron endonuclease
MYHFIYKTTNLVNGKYYIGKHSTDQLDDGYYGSGTVIKRAVKKYGRENFKTEILEFAGDESCLSKREKEIVNLDFVKDKQSYNVAEGGGGGCIVLGEGHPERQKTLDKIKLAHQKPETRKRHSDAAKKSLNLKKYNEVYGNPMLGRKHSAEAKMKIAERAKNRQRVSCPHCGIEVTMSNYTRWHGNRCKFNK